LPNKTHAARKLSSIMRHGGNARWPGTALIFSHQGGKKGKKIHRHSASERRDGGGTRPKKKKKNVGNMGVRNRVRGKPTGVYQTWVKFLRGRGEKNPNCSK